MATLRSALISRTLLMLAGLALCVQAAIPAGFMPDLDRQAGQYITICSGFGEKTVFMADEGAAHQDGAENACVFAFSSVGAELPGIILPILLAAILEQAPMPFPAFFQASRLARANPATGPPSIL